MHPFLVLCLFLNPIINEVMSNPEGPETGSKEPGDCNEFIEIYNPTGDTIVLEGYYIADLKELDSLVSYPDSTIVELYPGVVIGNMLLSPYSYALVLDREYTDSLSSYPHPYQIPEGVLILSTEDTDIGNGLSNSDRVYLISGDYDTVSRYETDLSPPDGFSIERRDPDASDTVSNWRVSRTGSTPGFKNSATLYIDLGVDYTSTVILPEEPDITDSIIVKINVYNGGLNPVDSFGVRISTDYETEEVIFNIYLESDDTTELTVPLGQFPEGYWSVSIEISHQLDEDTSNNSAWRSFLIGKPPVVINEIMYNDSSEWIELYNNSVDELDITDFYIEDRAGGMSGNFGEYSISPLGFIVIVDDSVSFKARFPGVEFIEPTGGIPTLNNTDDEIKLYDSKGTLLDYVAYSSSWGGDRGVSLERISPSLSSNSSSSWTSCVAKEGATPGSENSVLIETNTTQEFFGFSTRIFSPNEDGKDDFLVISYRLPEYPINLSIIGFDATGRLVKRIWSGEAAVGKGEIIWDGRGESGSILPSGLYIIYLEAKGNSLYKEKKTVVIKR